jgi:hypothetical protein
MFGALKMVFFTFVAVVVGVFVGTVPLGGRTLAERLADLYQARPAESAPRGAPRPARPEPVRAPSRKLAKPSTAMASVPTSAGAANTPDGHSADDEKALERIIAARSRTR